MGNMQAIGSGGVVADNFVATLTHFGGEAAPTSIQVQVTEPPEVRVGNEAAGSSSGSGVRVVVNDANTGRRTGGNCIGVLLVSVAASTSAAAALGKTRVVADGR